MPLLVLVCLSDGASEEMFSNPTPFTREQPDEILLRFIPLRHTDLLFMFVQMLFASEKIDFEIFSNPAPSI